MEIAKHASLLFNMRSIVQRAQNVDDTYRQTRGHLPIDQLQKSQDLLRGMSHVMAYALRNISASTVAHNYT